MLFTASKSVIELLIKLFQFKHYDSHNKLFMEIILCLQHKELAM